MAERNSLCHDRSPRRRWQGTVAVAVGHYLIEVFAGAMLFVDLSKLGDPDLVAYGLHQTAALLDHRLTLLWVGPRTAPPRQKTLQATLDWSYGLAFRNRTPSASPARRIRWTFYARCSASGRDECYRRLSDRLWRHLLPRRQFDSCDQGYRGGVVTLTQNRRF